MHRFCALWSALLTFTIIIISIHSVSADNLTEPVDISMNGTDQVLDQNGNGTDERNQTIPDLDPLIGTKKPMSDLSFSGSNGTQVNQTEKKPEPVQPENSQSYDSLGDIIAAKDWKALSEYTCKIKTENPTAFDDGTDTSGEPRERFRRFLSPDPPVETPASCCGS